MIVWGEEAEAGVAEKKKGGVEVFGLALDYWTGCVSVEVHYAGVGGIAEPDSIHVVCDSVRDQ